MPLLRPARVRARVRRRVRLRPRIATCLALLAAALLAPVTAAHAAPQDAPTRTVLGGRLDWGIKASFQSYVTGPIAQGSWSLTGGADTVGSSQFRFPSAQGTYDPATGALTAGFQGGVHFVGHRQSGGSYVLDLAISRPTVRISGRTGTLYADMRSKDKDTGKFTTTAQVPLASLALGKVSTKGATGTQLDLGTVPATLTAQGARAFAGYYTAGTALDPVTFSVDLHRPAAASATTPAKSPSASRSSSTTSGPLTGGAVDWGIRRTFREYVSGDIAHGRTQVSGGAQDGGAVYRFGSGKGSYDAKTRTLDASFTGTVRFLGLRAADGSYGLDLALSGVRVHLAGAKGTLYADGTAFATFTAPAAPTPRNGLLTVADAPTELTARGAAKFNGLYTAGTSMDPISVSAALTASAKLPALPDIGTAPTTAASAPATTPAPPAGSAPAAALHPENASDGTGTGAGTVTALSLGAAAVLAAAAFARVRGRGRRRDGAATVPGSGDGPAPEPGLGPGPTSGPEAD
ncbi:HtaA domain-containing protein [Actinacidiphila sp. bgisy145]|uniref:HtaA domain-containing protein n=1 Tax=Actinacidiphila sp. bgisy145 TaxID=3413792 RepID=UPI003EBF92AF